MRFPVLNGAPILLALILILAAAPVHAELTGRVTAEGGHLEHPLGIAVETASPYINGKLGLNFRVRTGGSLLRVTYEGSTYRFDPDVPLDYSRHAVGLEWVRPAAREDWTLSVGVQGASRRNIQGYRIYDHDEAYGYLAFKTYPHPRVMVRGWAGLRARTYDDLPEESYLEPHAVLEIKRFGGSRTTVGLSARLGGKWFNESVAKNVWGTTDTPSTSQLVTALSLSRGLSERFGVRANLSHRLTMAEFPYWVGEDIYDSPLLDRYARSGPSVLGAAKWLAPLQTWLEVGAAWREDDYGEIVFADGTGGGGLRSDTVVDTFASLKRRFMKQGKGATLTGTVSWRDQVSNLEVYTWTGLAFSAGLEWRW